MTRWYVSPWMLKLAKKIDSDSVLMEKMWVLAHSMNPIKKQRNGIKFAREVPHLPTATLDLDGTLVHTLIDPIEIAALEQSDLKTIRLPGKMGLVVQRPGLEQLFASLLEYNVVLYSAGGDRYVNAVVEKLVEGNPSLRGKFCKVLSRSDLVRYSEVSENPCKPCLDTEGISYVKDLRKAREDGNSQRVLIVDDNPYAFQVHPLMNDADFKRRYDFTLNAVPVPGFVATEPNAVLDTALARVGRILKSIAAMDDTLAALRVNLEVDCDESWT